MSTSTVIPIAAFAAEAVFSRVVVGVDGSEPGLEAARQAARLVAPEGSLELFTAVYLAEATRAGWSAPRLEAELEHEASEALRRARAIVGPRAESRLVNGPALSSLVRELRDRNATLAVVGTHDHRRLMEIVLGGVAGQLLHDAPCSICIARPPAVEALFPRAIVVGTDGSAESEAAVGVGQYLADRFKTPVRLVTALGGKDVDRQRAHGLGATFVDGHPVDALVEAAEGADLLVVGSRGLHGLKALGSVSERVAHQATCSVLVTRPNT